jgi:hypothetical protein
MQEARAQANKLDRELFEKLYPVLTSPHLSLLGRVLTRLEGLEHWQDELTAATEEAAWQRRSAERLGWPPTTESPTTTEPTTSDAPAPSTVPLIPSLHRHGDLTEAERTHVAQCLVCQAVAELFWSLLQTHVPAARGTNSTLPRRASRPSAPDSTPAPSPSNIQFDNESTEEKA